MTSYVVKFGKTDSSGQFVWDEKSGFKGNAGRIDADEFAYQLLCADGNCRAHVVPVKPKKRRRRSAMDIAAEACGLVKVRGALGGVYYE